VPLEVLAPQKNIKVAIISRRGTTYKIQRLEEHLLASIENPLLCMLISYIHPDDILNGIIIARIL
jgi:hypothetical protein